MSELPRFGSPRQALAYLYAHHRGPTLARPRYDDAPAETGRSHWDASAVGVLLYGDRGLGNCGIVRGSELDDRLRAWSTSAHMRACKNPKRCDCLVRTCEVENAERQMRRAMRAARMLRERPRVPRVARYAEADGSTSARVWEPCEKSRCTSAQDVPMVP